jgi:hypothetical protein
MRSPSRPIGCRTTHEVVHWSGACPLATPQGKGGGARARDAPGRVRHPRAQQLTATIGEGPHGRVCHQHRSRRPSWTPTVRDENAADEGLGTERQHAEGPAMLAISGIALQKQPLRLGRALSQGCSVTAIYGGGAVASMTSWRSPAGAAAPTTRALIRRALIRYTARAGMAWTAILLWTAAPVADVDLGGRIVVDVG